MRREASGQAVWGGEGLLRSVAAAGGIMGLSGVGGVVE